MGEEEYKNCTMFIKSKNKESIQIIEQKSIPLKLTNNNIKENSFIGTNSFEILLSYKQSKEFLLFIINRLKKELGGKYE